MLKSLTKDEAEEAEANPILCVGTVDVWSSFSPGPSF